jgi:hypothetical protein
MVTTGFRRAAPAAFLAAVVGLLFVACGGEPSGVGEDFAARAAQVCQAALESKQAWSQFPVPNFDPVDPDPAAFPEVSTWLEDQVAPTFESWLDGLEALGDPPSAREAWADVLGAVERITAGNADEIAAAKAADVHAFVVAHDRLEQTQNDLETSTAEAGVASCADIHA